MEKDNNNHDNVSDGCIKSHCKDIHFSFHKGDKDRVSDGRRIGVGGHDSTLSALMQFNNPCRIKDLLNRHLDKNSGEF